MVPQVLEKLCYRTNTKEFDEVIKIQFHPSMAYEQFIGGYSVDKNGNITLK